MPLHPLRAMVRRAIDKELRAIDKELHAIDNELHAIAKEKNHVNLGCLNKGSKADAENKTVVKKRLSLKRKGNACKENQAVGEIWVCPPCRQVTPRKFWVLRYDEKFGTVNTCLNCGLQGENI